MLFNMGLRISKNRMVAVILQIRKPLNIMSLKVVIKDLEHKIINKKMLELKTKIKFGLSVGFNHLGKEETVRQLTSNKFMINNFRTIKIKIIFYQIISKEQK